MRNFLRFALAAPALPPAIQAQVPSTFKPPAGMANFPATQEAPAKRFKRGSGRESPLSPDAPAASTSNPPAMQQQVQQQGEDAQEPQTVEEVPKDVKDGNAMDVGYGPNGTTAQSPLDDGSEYFMKDRYVMQRTVTHKKHQSLR